MGHTVRLMPPVKRGKTDAADAEGICEAVTRRSMRFVAVKTMEQQAAPMLHKTRDLLVRQRTMLINGLRGHLAEFGIIAAKGPGGVKVLIGGEDRRESVPDLTLTEFRLLAHLARMPKRVFSRGELLEACLPEGEALE